MSNPTPTAIQSRVVGDDVKETPENPFHLNFSPGMAVWMARQNVALALSTYTAGKVVLAGSDRGKLVVSERNFGRAMAMLPLDNGLLLSTEYQIWRFEDGLEPGRMYDGWDKILLPRKCHVTGAVDTHDLAYDKDGHLIAAVTLYNCLARIDEQGCFTPTWKPPFIDAIVGEDRCHLNGFCLEQGEPAYVSLTGVANTRGGWREHRAAGGLVMDMRTNEVIVEGLSMPHSPRLYRDKLWLLEAGRGYFGYVDLETKAFVPVTWCPGFTRGLRFFGDYALVGISKPRHKTFQGLPLEEMLEERGEEPVCGLYVIRLSDGEIVHRLTISGSVEEIYDVCMITGTRSPMLVGLQGKEVRQLIKMGDSALL